MKAGSVSPVPPRDGETQRKLSPHACYTDSHLRDGPSHFPTQNTSGESRLELVGIHVPLPNCPRHQAGAKDHIIAPILPRPCSAAVRIPFARPAKACIGRGQLGELAR